MELNTVEGNKLILESPFAADHHKKWLGKLDKFEGKRDAAYENAKFHSSWDWLMPVVEKIGKTSPYIIHERGMRISDAGITYKSPISTINAVWEAVVLYIQWYNSQPNNRLS